MVETLADKARKIARDALASRLRLRDRTHDPTTNYFQTVAQAEDEARDVILPRIRGEIIARAFSGRRSYTETLLSWWAEGDHPPTEAKVRVLTELLQAEGFEVSACGDGYDKLLRVSW